MFKKILLLSFISIFLISCKEDKRAEQIKASVQESPFAILANRKLVFVVGDEVIEYELKAPWSILKFKFENKSDLGVVIVAATFIITDPITGKEVIIAHDNMDSRTGVPRTFFSTIKAEGDTDCDGTVEKEESAAPESCPLDQGDLSKNNSLAYLHGLSSQSAATPEEGEGGDQNTQAANLISEQYRGVVFGVRAKFEGWYGSLDDPQSNFFKEIFFSISAN